MNDYQPKVGDKVMVSEHGPYEVGYVGPAHYVEIYVYDRLDVTRSVLPEWLTPAPEPEPDLPTTPGALVRDGKDDLLVLDAERDWVYLTGEYPGSCDSPLDITRPITVILNDPAEVETLRADLRQANRALHDCNSEVERVRATAEAPTADLVHARRRADELQRRIEKAEEAASHATVNANRFEAERDELQRRIDFVLRVDLVRPDGWVAKVLRGES